MYGPYACAANGSVDVSSMMSRAEQIMISHLKDNFLAIALCRADLLTFSRTTNVPTAPMLTTPNLLSCFASSAGRQRFAPPTFTARKNTTQRIWKSPSEVIRDRLATLFPTIFFPLDCASGAERQSAHAGA